jgi:AcrR family transcriptional regulator
MARPRSARAHNDVLDAAAALFAERGIEGTSMDAIAAESGVSKATIYKHWPDKDALLLESMLRVHGRDETPDYDTGELRADLILVLSHRPPEQYTSLRERLTPHLLAYSARNPEFGNEWRARILRPPRLQLINALQRGIARNELPRDLDIDIAVSLLMGPTMYAWLMKVLEKKIFVMPAEVIADVFLKSYAIAPKPAKAKTDKKDVRRTTRRAARRPDRHASPVARG